MRPLRRSPRLYEQVVQQVVSWAASDGLGPGTGSRPNVISPPGWASAARPQG